MVLVLNSYRRLENGIQKTSEVQQMPWPNERAAFLRALSTGLKLLSWAVPLGCLSNAWHLVSLGIFLLDDGRRAGQQKVGGLLE